MYRPRRHGRHTGHPVAEAFSRKELILVQRSKPSVRKKHDSSRKGKERWLTPELKRKIAVEAKALGLRQSEYLRLVVSISESMRNSIQTKETLDWKVVAKWADSPLWPILMGVISQTVSSLISEEGENQKSEGVTKQDVTRRAAPIPSQERIPGPSPFGWPTIQGEPLAPKAPPQRTTPPMYYNGYL